MISRTGHSGAAPVAFALGTVVDPENPSINARIPIMMHHERRVIAMHVFFLVVVALLVLAFGGLEVIESHRLVDADPPSNIPMSRTWYWK